MPQFWENSPAKESTRPQPLHWKIPGFFFFLGRWQITDIALDTTFNWFGSAGTALCVSPGELAPSSQAGTFFFYLIANAKAPRCAVSISPAVSPQCFHAPCLSPAEGAARVEPPTARKSAPCSTFNRLKGRTDGIPSNRLGNSYSAFIRPPEAAQTIVWEEMEIHRISSE